MKKSELAHFIQRYISYRNIGKDMYFDADEIDEALEELETIEDYTYYDEILDLGLRLHPESIVLKTRKCHSLFLKEKYNETLALLDAIGNTGDPDLLLLRLQSYCMLQQFDQVHALIDRLAAEKNEELEYLIEDLVEALSDFGMYKEAHDFIKWGLRMFPQNNYLKEELCHVLELEGDIDKAIEKCNELIDRDPYSFESWYNLGHLYSVQHEHEKAVEAFDFALTCETDDKKDLQEEIKELKAQNLSQIGKYNEAIELYQEILKDNSEKEIHIIPFIAECHIHLADYAKAYHLLHNLLIKHGKFEQAETYLYYFHCCTATGKSGEEQRVLFQDPRLFPHDSEFPPFLVMRKPLIEDMRDPIEHLYKKAFILQMEGDLTNALICYKKVWNTHPDIPFINLYMALIYLEMGDLLHFNEYVSKLQVQDFYIFTMDFNISAEKSFPLVKDGSIVARDLVKEFLKNKDNNN